MKTYQSGLVKTIIVAIVALILIGAGWYLYKDNQLKNINSILGNNTNTQIQTTSGEEKVGGVGGGGVKVPTNNNFTVTSPSKGEVWDKGDDKKVIKWTYPKELRGREIHLGVYLINLDKLAQGKDESEATLEVRTAFITVPNDGVGELNWAVMRAIPETSFYGYSANSKIVITLSSAKSSENYEASSENFMVSNKIVGSSMTRTPLNVTYENGNVSGVGMNYKVSWTGGYTNMGEPCDFMMSGPIDEKGEVIQSKAAIVTLGSVPCANKTFTAKFDSSYLLDGYSYNFIIKTPYEEKSQRVYLKP